jgi:hypothetical protein
MQPLFWIRVNVLIYSWEGVVASYSGVVQVSFFSRTRNKEIRKGGFQV